MPDTSGTSPDAERSGENARHGRTNNYYCKPERPRNNIGGLEELTLIKRSWTPALDLKKVKEALENKIQCEQKDGYIAATLLSEAESQTGSVGQSQQSGGPSRPIPPSMPDHTSDDFMVNGTFNSIMYEAAVLRFQNESVVFQAKLRAWEANISTAAGTSKHTTNNAHVMVATLMGLLSDDLRVEVESDERFPSLKAGGILNACSTSSKKRSAEWVMENIRSTPGSSTLKFCSTRGRQLINRSPAIGSPKTHSAPSSAN